MVKSLVAIGLLGAGFLVSMSQGDAQVEIDAALVPKSFLSGKDWRGLSQGEQQAYAVGVVDGLDLAFVYGKQGTDLAWINPCVTGMSSDRIRAMLLAELNANPEEWKLLTVHQTMYRALRRACRQSPGIGR